MLIFSGIEIEMDMWIFSRLWLEHVGEEGMLGLGLMVG